MQQARRALVLVLSGAALLVGAVAAERTWFSIAHAKASRQLALAEQVAGRIRLADQRLTAAAQMAVASGERHWVDEYDAQLPVLNEALAQARALAPAQVGADFDAVAETAQQQLYDMRESAFEAVTVGAVDVARTIFEGERYRSYTARLALATAEVADATVAAGQERAETLRQQSLAVLLLLTSAGVASGLVLWRGLTQRLDRSRDVLRQAEQRVQRLASRDLLTDLPNRAALHDAVVSSLGRAGRVGGSMAVMMVDLDRFKPVNDRHGHLVGDAVLKQVADRLSLCVREGDLCARYGGDEFVIAVDEPADGLASHAIASRVVQALSQPMHCEGLTLQIGASIGIARFPHDAATTDDLLRLADSALYRAKQRGRGEICYYEQALDRQVAERHALEQEIRDGIAAGQFLPHYQPIVRLDGGQIMGVEMLCRWQHPTRGLQAPAQFIGLAESCGLIDPLLFAVLDRALPELHRFPPSWRMSINVAPAQMQDLSVVPRLLSALARHGVAPQRLDIELTETVLVRDTGTAMQVMQAMKNAGMTVTLDDFGTGYSSLSYLTEMRFDRIKIDRSFVRTLHDRQQSAAIVDAVLGLSRGLGVQVVAEGVETERDAQALLRMGCTMAQGFHFSRPEPAERLLASSAGAGGEPAAAVARA